MEGFRIAAAVVTEIEAHARAEAPRECCGLLLGAGVEIRRAERTRNLAASATRYDIDPVDHFRILREARRDGVRVIGAYHSHPHSVPVPSQTDLAEGLPNFLYVIVTLLEIYPRLRAFYIDGAASRPVPLVTVD